MQKFHFAKIVKKLMTILQKSLFRTFKENMKIFFIFLSIDFYDKL